MGRNVERCVCLQSTEENCCKRWTEVDKQTYSQRHHEPIRHKESAMVQIVPTKMLRGTKKGF